MRTNKVMLGLMRDRERIFERVSVKKLGDYDYTQVHLRRTNVSTDSHYQRVYKSFYVMGRRRPEWYDFYFGLLEEEKANQGISFKVVLRRTYEAIGRVEPSFSSKLVATIRPDAPVYDDGVRDNLGIQKPRLWKSKEIRLAEADQAYEKIEIFYRESLLSDTFAALKAEFDQRLPQFVHFMATKKLDILLWQWRRA